MFYTNDANILAAAVIFLKIQSGRSLQSDSFRVAGEIIKEDSTVLEAYCTPLITDKAA
ncbi:MAG: hypothetical protein ACI9DG_000559 [Oleispira sp.]|jgi:hypothetical protein